MQGAISACVLAFSIASVAKAAVLAPAGLSPGDTYQLAFVSSTQTTAVSGDIGTYNAFVQNLADLAGIGVSESITWSAIGSPSPVTALAHALVSAPVYNMVGERVANGFIDIWDGNLENPINYTESGVKLTRTVWTGSAQDGTAAMTGATPVYLGSQSVAHGNSDRFDSAWVIDFSFQLNSTANSLYALSSVMTVIPVPPSVWLFGSGLLGLAGIARRKKKA